ncbi:heavy metal transporter [Candidatus Cerribacteria bacterium 'Amazon FNV 2010 28 9']|uniref:Heavy metal transporter n=1 Tax=Candidatus Cerribacteria bacterium 'Amazon FNV 2010 28 9' TaxID=2081795 RepID=A0A317JNG9_9BACT|nr:MAG: heavy metal transporter [Candidatus Cerribacteria bacterium 'Amazon FNV 2010 28 9']
MLPLFQKKKSSGTEVVFRISGMHCVSCAMNIDGQLEETKGVYQATTNYAKSITRIRFDSAIIKIETIQKIIESLGYAAFVKE